MLVLPEEGNKFDNNVMKAMMPDNLAEELLEEITRQRDSSPKKVKNILGKQVGKVPAKLCRVFRSLLVKEMTVGPIMCYIMIAQLDIQRVVICASCSNVHAHKMERLLEVGE